jgi:hypothetical protein
MRQSNTEKFPRTKWKNFVWYEMLASCGGAACSFLPRTPTVLLSIKTVLPAAASVVDHVHVNRRKGFESGKLPDCLRAEGLLRGVFSSHVVTLNIVLSLNLVVR